MTAVAGCQNSPFRCYNNTKDVFPGKTRNCFSLLQIIIEDIIFWSCQNVCDALSFLLDNIYIRHDTKLYRKIVGITMGTNCAPLVADTFLFCYERDFMLTVLVSEFR